MSGVLVVFHRDGREVDRRLASTMLRAAASRGPDGLYLHASGSVALGHARIIVSAEDGHSEQPLVSKRTGCWITADARLDSRADLISRLELHSRPAPSDAELILHAYEAWGSRLVERLLGDFAFAVWDPRRHVVVCARDTSGQRPLFYRCDSQSFVAASDILQLLQDPAVPIAVNEARLQQYLVDLQIGRNEKDSAETFYDGVKAVPAGHVLEASLTEARLRKYWDIDSSREVRYRDDSEYADHFRSLLFQAVKDRLRTVQPVGALLSGGLDSSSVVCVAQALRSSSEIHVPSMTGFSAVYGDMDCDERPLIEDVQRSTGVHVEYIFAPRARGSKLTLETEGFMSGPSLWSGQERDALLGAAARRGVRVLLTGEIADNCISGARLVFDSLLRHGSWSRLAHDLSRYRRVSSESLPTILGLYCVAPLLPKAMQGKVAAWRLRRSFVRLRDELLPGWLADDVREHTLQRLLTQRLDEVTHRQFASPAREGEYRLLYPPEVAPSYGAWPLEFSRPFADRRLHEFLLAIPPEQKYRPHPTSDELYAGSKWLLRQSMRGLLPESIRSRTNKTVFNATFEHEMKSLWPAYEATFGPSSHPMIAARGYVDADRFWVRLNRVRDGDVGTDLVYLLRMVELETWLRSLDRPRPRLVHSVAQPVVASL